MNDYLEIFSDVVLLATFQPRWRERYSSAPRLGEVSRRPDPGADRFSGSALRTSDRI